MSGRKERRAGPFWSRPAYLELERQQLIAVGLIKPHPKASLSGKDKAV